MPVVECKVVAMAGGSDKSRRTASQAGVSESRGAETFAELTELRNEFTNLRKDFLGGRDSLVADIVDKLSQTLGLDIKRLNGTVEDVNTWCAKQDAQFSSFEQRLRNIEVKFNRDIAEVYEEVQERASRCCNLVVHGIPEDVEDVKACFVKHYEKALGSEVSAADIRGVHRLGRRRAEMSSPSSRPRPVLVKFNSFDQRQTALRNKRLFSSVQDGFILYLDPDLTRKQQQQKRALVPTFKTLKARNSRPFWRSEVLWYHPQGKEVPEMHASNVDPSQKLTPDQDMSDAPQPDASAPSTSGAPAAPAQ